MELMEELEIKRIEELKKSSMRDFIIYFGIAGIGFIVNVSSRVVYSRTLNLDFTVAMVLAYLTGMVVAFILTKLFAFDSRRSGRTSREAIKFVAVTFVAMAVTIMIAELALDVHNKVLTTQPKLHEFIIGLIDPFGWKFIDRQLASHLIGMCFGFFVNFFGHKMVTFKNTGMWDRYNAVRGNVSRERRAPMEEEK